MSVNFRDLLPALQTPLDQLANVELIKHLNQTTWLFAIVETVHILSMVVLGGAVLVLNLRLLEAILRDMPVARVEQATRPWLIAGIAGTILTGLYMALATIVTLLPNAAFFVKMIALVAAILLSLAVSRQVRAGAGAAGRPPLGLAASAAALWLAALVLFASTTALSSGAMLVALAGFVLFAGFLGTYRWTYLGLLAVAAVLSLGFAIRTGASPGAMPGVVAIALGLGAVTIAAVLEARRRDDPLLDAPRVAAFSSLLAWITVAAAGRWIGFS